MNAVSDNAFTQTLSQLGNELPTPKAILMISADWLKDETAVYCGAKPPLIYDFYGFPEELYQIKYPATGAPEIARLISETVQSVPIACDNAWGLDHGAWTVLKHLYPNANIPVFQLSVDYQFGNWHPKPLDYHFNIGKELRFLREQGVLIIGSGNITHNLGILNRDDIDANPMGWAADFDTQVKNALVNRDYDALINYQTFGNSAHIAVPTLDHYLPMIYVLGLIEEEDPIKFIFEGFHYGSLSMRCFQIG